MNHPRPLLASALMVLPLFLLACTQPASDAPRLTLSPDGDTLTVLDATTSTPILTAALASCTDANADVIPFPLAAAATETSPFSDPMGTGTETTLNAAAGTLDLTWTLRTFTSTPLLVARLAATNTGTAATRIARLTPLSTPADAGGLALGTTDTLRYLDINPRTWAPKAVKTLEDPASHGTWSSPTTSWTGWRPRPSSSSASPPRRRPPGTSTSRWGARRASRCSWPTAESWTCTSRPGGPTISSRPTAT